MKAFPKAVATINRISLMLLLTCLLSVEAQPSMSLARTYVAKNLPANSQIWTLPEFSFHQQADSSVRKESADSLKLKDPRMAVFYAVIPGIIVHGSGHFYAGKTKTGAALLGSELVGGALAFVGAVGKGMSEMDGGQSTWEAGDVLMVTGTILFVGSWLYDLIGAPLALQKRNEELRRKETLSVGFRSDRRRVLVGFQITKAF
ncbi:MAG: P13 family porin [Candidatus Zixiibacteriota bacterium]